MGLCIAWKIKLITSHRDTGHSTQSPALEKITRASLLHEVKPRLFPTSTDPTIAVTPLLVVLTIHFQRRRRGGQPLPQRMCFPFVFPSLWGRLGSRRYCVVLATETRMALRTVAGWGQDVWSYTLKATMIRSGRIQLDKYVRLHIHIHTHTHTHTHIQTHTYKHTHTHTHTYTYTHIVYLQVGYPCLVCTRT